jgi:hypothetical protein
MPATYEPIATTTLGTAGATITFSSIPATYTDLRLAVTSVPSGAIQYGLRFNNDSSALYSLTELVGNGASAASDRDSNDTSLYFNYFTPTGSTIPAFMTADIFSYAGSTNKTSLLTWNNDRNGAGDTVIYTVGLYRSTSAITRLDIILTSGTMGVGTTATLYGIKNA